MNRDDMLAQVRDRKQPWDIAVIGGGATGVGIAIDAAVRGYDVALFEQADFGKGTSSRSTKLAHGGVRYLQQGHIGLVREALRERSLLRQNAPHLVKDMPFLVPTYAWWESFYYGTGLRVYDWLAGRESFSPSVNLAQSQTLARIPTLKNKNLRGSVVYHDGQFDDARLLITLARTAADRGAVLLNYAKVTELLRDTDGKATGLIIHDEETGEELHVPSRVIINATGPFSDAIRRMSAPSAKPIIVPSQGVHLVLPSKFLPGDTALMIPRTKDGRVMFAIPWYGHVLVGTTDTPIQEVTLEPRPLNEEIDFLLDTAAHYFETSPTFQDVLSVFAGIRPLVAPKGHRPNRTAKLSRHHHIDVDAAGVVTIAGGKWTTYRNMAEDCVNRAAQVGGLPLRPCPTPQLRLHGYRNESTNCDALAHYGEDAAAIQALTKERSEWANKLHPALPYLEAEVIWAARWEMARTVEDVLARRTRALLLNPSAALSMATRVAELLAEELQKPPSWQAEQVNQFSELAERYRFH